jgi:hypothetical protein
MRYAQSKSVFACVTRFRARSAPIVVSIACVGCVAACSDAAPVRLAVEADTLLISMSQPLKIPVHAVAQDGRLAGHSRLTFASNSSVVRAWPDGRVACTRPGDAVVTIAERTVTTHIVVECRRRMWLSLSGANETLWVGGPPRDVAVVAYDSANHAVHLPPGTATARIHDDSIARIIGGRIYALSRGRTSVDVQFDGVSGGAAINVVERAVHDSLRLVGGELRTWRVTRGYYELRLDVSAPRERRPGLVLAAYHAKCYSVPRDDGRHYFCNLADDSAIIVRNMSPVGPSSALSGELTVLRLP